MSTILPLNMNMQNKDLHVISKKKKNYIKRLKIQLNIYLPKQDL